MGRQAASAKDRPAGLGMRFVRGTATRSASVPGSARRGARSRAGRPGDDHRVDDHLVAVRVRCRPRRSRGSSAAGRPAGHAAQRPEVVVVERAGPHARPSPSRRAAVGSGRSPTVSPASGSASSNAEAKAARMTRAARNSAVARWKLRTRPGRVIRRPRLTGSAGCGAWPAGDAVAAGGFGDRRGHGRRDPRVERRDGTIASARQVVGDHSGDRVGRGHLHRLGDPGGAGVQRAAEDAGEGQHVVDLVGEVAAAGGDHRGVPGGDVGVHLGRRVGQREDDRRRAPSRPAPPRRSCPPETPMSTSAPTSASAIPPVTPAGWWSRPARP